MSSSERDATASPAILKVDGVVAQRQDDPKVVTGGTLSLSEVLVRDSSSQGRMSGAEVVLSSDENDPMKPLTTTISTIAVQSGRTRIVIALLQSKDWLQLKIQEMQPAMTEIGANLEEALQLQQQHQEALEKLQTKQSPVEELLNQADELISNQKPRAEVYSAMAENLGLAWKDLNAQLDQRRLILEQAVVFHTRAKDFSERMDQAHREFSDTFLPENADACRSLLERIHDVKKGILEGSMRTLSEGQSMLERLCEVATHSMGDSRPAHMRHVAQQTCQFVEQYMENLHDRRRHLEAMFLQRKIKLEQCLQMCLIYHDINEIKQWLRGKGADSLNNKALGDSAATAEILQHEHVKLQAEAKEVQDRAIRLLSTSEQLSAGGHYAGEEIRNRAYETLEECSDFLSSMENRHELLSMAVSFFNAAQTALNKLDQIEVQVTTDSSRITTNLTQTIDEITGPALQEGYALLDSAGRHEPGSQGVARKVAELENRRIKLSSLCTVHETENQERQLAFKKFMDSYSILRNWLVNVGQACLQGHQDMGSVLTMAKDFLERHERLQNDLRLKGIEVDALLTTVPALVRNGGEEAEIIHQKADELRQGWDQLRMLLETRILLAQRYLGFHKLAVQLGKEMDGIDDAMKGDKSQFTESLFRQHEERWVSVQQMIFQFNNTGKNFIADAKKVQDPYLDTQRAIVCVEHLLEQVKQRKDAFNNLWGNWKVEMAEGKEQRNQWEKFTKEVHRTLDEVHSFELQLFPIIPSELHNADSISDHLERTEKYLDSKMTHVFTELDVKRKTAELFTVKEIQPQKDKLQTELSSKLQTLQSKVTEYHVLLSMMIGFFKNFKELEKILSKQEVQYKTAILTSELERAEATVREHEANKHAALDLIRFTRNEADQVINKIEAVEPPLAAVKDKDKINTLIESREKGMESVWEDHKKRLEQNLQYCHFTRDLQEINHHLDTLQAQLDSMRGNYGESLPAAKVTSVAFIQFEKTLELLEIRIRQFVSTAERMLNDQHVESRSIHNELQTVQTKWSTFHTQVGENRKRIDLAIHYFSLVEEAEEWFREGSQVLISIARKSTNCRTPQEANNLLNEVEQFLKPGERRQQERIDKISALAVQLYGIPTHTSILQVSDKNRDMLDSFAVINEELSTLALNLKVAEEDRAKERKEKEDAEDALKAAQAEAAAAKAAAAAAQEAARASDLMAKSKPMVREAFQQTIIFKQEAIPLPPKQEPPLAPPPMPEVPPQKIQLPSPPIFVVPLSNETIMEGTKITFECKVEGFPTPYVQWLKDGILIQNNPDYVTSFEDGICKLSIEETFAEDSAKFTCKATNAAGVAETQGSLTVKESRPHEELIAPRFTKEMVSGSVQEGKQHQFDCTVTGHPLPLISWFKNDVCIDNSPDYVSSANNGECTLLVKESTLEDDGRFTCRATNPVGESVCSAKLSVIPLATISAPVVLTPLSNVMARAGQKLRLECRVKGEPLPAITWLHNNKVIKDNRDAKLQYDGDRAALVITEAFPKDAGTYQVLAKNDAGDAASSCTVLVKGRLPLETSDSELASDMEPIKPQVMKHLTNQTVIEGSRTRMDCVIVGQPEPEVIWYHNGKPVKESDDFQLLFEGDACTLIIKEAYLEDSGSYKCVAINSGGEASTQCSLSVDPLSEMSDVERSQRDVLISVEKAIPPRFTKLLNDVAISEGNKIALDCKVAGEPEPSVTWFKNEQSLEPSINCQINQLNDGQASLSIPEAKLDDAGFYSVKANNKCGQAKCFCTVTVFPKMIAPVSPLKPSTDKSPTFIKHIQDTHVLKDSEAQFECAVAGVPKPDVTWTFRGWPIQPDAQHKIEEQDNTHKLTLPQVKVQDTGRYSVTAENHLGISTSSAMLTVEEPLQEHRFLDGFTEQKAHSSVMTKKTSIMQQSRISSVTQQFESGSTVQVHQSSSMEQQGMSVVSGQQPQSYHNIEKSEYHQNLSHGIPEFKPLSLPGVLSGTMERSVVVSQSSQPTIKMEIVQAPRAVAPRFSRPVTSALVNEGDKINLEGQIEGHPEPVVKWFKNGIELFRKPGLDVTYENGKATLTVEKSSENDTARYSCTATNAGGSATSSADVVVKPYRVPPKFIQRLSPAVVKSGERVTLEVQVDGHPAPEVTWYRNDVQLRNSPDIRIKSEGQRHYLVIPEVFPDDAGNLMVKAINAAGEAQSIANLIVEEDVSPNGFREYSVVEQKHEFQSKMASTKTENLTQLRFQEVRDDRVVSPMILSPTVSPKPPPPVPPPKPVAPVEAKLWKPSKIVGSAKIGPVVEDSCDEDEIYTLAPLEVIVPSLEPPQTTSLGLLKQASPIQPITINTMDYQETVTRQESIRTSVQSTPKSSPRPIIKKETDSAYSSPRPKKEVVIEEQPIMGTEVRAPIFSVPLKDLLLQAGQSVTLECQVDAHPTPTFRWFRDKQPIMSSAHHNIVSCENSSMLTISSVQPEDNAVFTCTAVNAGGNKSTSSQITVQSFSKYKLRPPKKFVTW